MIGKLTGRLDTVSDNGAIIDVAGVGYSVFASSRTCLLYTSPSPRDGLLSRMPSSA